VLVLVCFVRSIFLLGIGTFYRKNEREKVIKVLGMEQKYGIFRLGGLIGFTISQKTT